MNHLRRAGISVPLFSLRSSRSWGIGEIGDIPALADWLRSAHQSVLQILPLNELAPGESSPYSALSAMAIDPRYISIGRLEEAADLEMTWRHEIEAVQASPRIDYKQVGGLKDRALHACFSQFYQAEWLRSTQRADALRAYIAKEHWWLDEYSLYRALRAHAGERPWTEWNPALRDRDPVALAAAREQLSSEILFFQYVQWIAADEWQAVRRGIEGVDIFGDLPFMVSLDSADVWSRQRDFILDACVGTPPDAFSETGQEWGFPPYRWDEVRKNDFEWIRMRARRLADLYGGFRVDHLVGFYRTYVRPSNGLPYFSPASEDEQRALGESVMGIMMNTGADVSVEDLGIVPDFVRASVAELGLPGYRVFRWERGGPSTYPAASVAMTGTHDTEPLAVWWDSLLPEEQRAILNTPGAPFDVSIRDNILQAIYNSASRLVLLPVQDVFGWRDRINHPATIGEWNWTYVLPWPVDRMAQEGEAIEAADRLRKWSDEAGRWNRQSDARP